MPNPYWFLSSFVNALAVARNSSHVQSSLGGVMPYSLARSARQWTPSLVTTHGNERILPRSVTVCQAIGVTSLECFQSRTRGVRSSTAPIPSNSPTQLSQTWQQSGGLLAAMDVMSFCRACACGTNSTLTSKSFCDWLKRWASDSTSAVRLGSGTLNWNRTGWAPHARRGPTRGSSHHARSAAATTPAAAIVRRSCRRERAQRSSIVCLLRVERWRGCNTVARRVSRPRAGVLSAGDRGIDPRRARGARLGADLGGERSPRALAGAGARLGGGPRRPLDRRGRAPARLGGRDRGRGRVRQGVHERPRAPRALDRRRDRDRRHRVLRVDARARARPRDDDLDDLPSGRRRARRGVPRRAAHAGGRRPSPSHPRRHPPHHCALWPAG